jgi:hypothetical protein
MDDFVRVVGLDAPLNAWGLAPDQNFEDIFSDLYEKGDVAKVKVIHAAVERYFGTLELPNTPTIYDHLVLSLRRTDLIATFNWDPLLVQAYRRNIPLGLSLPQLRFLHGNIGVGYCLKDRMVGATGNRCSKCGDFLERTPLLYPIRRKDYASNLFIANEWEALKQAFQDAFMITIFGYSGPKTDTEARVAMKKAWGSKNRRSMEQTAFITLQAASEIYQNWKPFIHTHHYESCADFYESWIANHPRRTGEAYWNQYYEAKFISNNPIPRHMDFAELWQWYGEFAKAEIASSTR